jgi:alanyl-tRNA synthetase
MTGNEIRKKFFEYFRVNDHQIVRSSSLVPQDDPTLLFTNAGMVQFKRVFLGEEKRDYSRAATSQKCLRAGGKHNDLENVGYTARHHTFFEMLGNFSFGDYFKEKAIGYAWDFLVSEMKLPSEKLWVSIYLDDDESHDIWAKQIGVPEDRIVRLGEKDNFWSMGETGPCGPCTEILIDRGAETGCKTPACAVGCECDRYLELWNLVFMQYNRDADGNMNPLPKPSIDTGMGLERIASVIQGVPTNYDTDLFVPIIRTIETLCGRKAGDNRKTNVAMKVIADHSRAAAFLIGDGVLPSNEGRGYVLRRILRRAIRYGRSLNLTEPFLYKVVESVFEMMREGYPELAEEAPFITNVCKNEEIRFFETLDNGLKLLEETLRKMEAQSLSVVPGDVIFKLYDTYGFPVDIVSDIVREKNLDIDMAGFEQAMAQRREQSRSVSAFSSISDAYRSFSASMTHLPAFTGYHRLEDESELLLVVVDGNAAERAMAGQEIEMVTGKTPFYAESGGQAGDCGAIYGDGFEIEVHDTFKDPTGLIIHRGKVVSGTVSKGAKVRLAVDEKKRKATANNHTATHLLHYALRKVLGDHVRQAGSFVGPERMRFDFTHFSPVSIDDREGIERLVNEKIRENVEVKTNEMDAEEAFKSGAVALFEEKYGDRVRVVSLAPFSSELCGGTHTDRTGSIGVFKILSETGIASGVRRIEAFTGEAAFLYIQSMDRMLNDAARLFKDRPEALTGRIETLMAGHKQLEKTLEQLKLKLASASAGQMGDDIRSVNGVKVIAKTVSADNPGALRNLADRFRDNLKSGVVVLGAPSGDKAMLVVVVTKDLADRFHAGNIIREIAPEVGGGGGGRPDMAQAGGSKPEKLDRAIEKAWEVIQQAAGG